MNLKHLRGIELLALRIKRPDMTPQINAELARRTFGGITKRKSIRQVA